jgi:antitoxin MazE
MEGLQMDRTVKLKKLGGSTAVVLPKPMLDRLNLDAGDEVHVVETENGLLITPYNRDFDEAMAIYKKFAAKYRNALRELAK